MNERETHAQRSNSPGSVVKARMSGWKLSVLPIHRDNQQLSFLSMFIILCVDHRPIEEHFCITVIEEVPLRSYDARYGMVVWIAVEFREAREGACERSIEGGIRKWRRNTIREVICRVGTMSAWRDRKFALHKAKF